MGACNRLKAELGALRVCIGWRQGDTVRLVAMSDTENIDRRAELNQRLEAAMEECFDQARPIVAPSHHLRGDDQWLALAVARCHQELIGDIGRAAACSVPLRHQDEVVGVLLVEQPGQSNFDGHAVAHLQAVADLIAPRLFDRKLDDQPVLKKLAQSAAAVVGVVLGPQHIATKLIVLIVASLLLYSVLAKWDYRLDATFTFEAGAKRVHSASFEGYLQSVLVEPGDAVKKGQELARLDDTELRLRLAEVESAIEQATTARLESMRENKLADAKRAAAQVQQLTAQRELYKFQLERAVLTSADDGVVLSGDWVEKQGVRVQLGEPIFEVAPISQLRAVIMVDESDIDRVAPGAAGELASRTYPDKLFGFRVTRIVPLGEAFEGRNVFQVYGELGEHADWMRPGMQGTAKIDAGRARVIWIGTHKLIDFLRLKLWW
jgi:multidrug efflux pump subunit AcrA (membrane-fusion protein)